MFDIAVSLLSVAHVVENLVRRHSTVRSLYLNHTMRNTEHEGACNSLIIITGSDTFSMSFTISVHFSCVVAIQVVVESNNEIISSLSQLTLLTEILEMR